MWQLLVPTATCRRPCRRLEPISNANGDLSLNLQSYQTAYNPDLTVRDNATNVVRLSLHALWRAANAPFVVELTTNTSAAPALGAWHDHRPSCGAPGSGRATFLTSPKLFCGAFQPTVIVTPPTRPIHAFAVARGPVSRCRGSRDPIVAVCRRAGPIEVCGLQAVWPGIESSDVAPIHVQRSASPHGRLPTAPNLDVSMMRACPALKQG